MSYVPLTLHGRVALAIWQAREMRFDSRVRRMNPDNIDIETGAWSMVMQEAKAAIETYETVMRERMERDTRERDAQSARERPPTFQRTGAGEQA